MRNSKLTSANAVLMTAALIASAAISHADEHLDAIPETHETNAEITSLSLRAAVNLAIENNLGVEIERHAPLITANDQQIAWGAYEPVATADLTYSNDRTQGGSNVFATTATREIATRGSVGLEGLVPLLGARLSVDYTGSRTRTKGNGFEALSPKYNSGLAISAQVPLLRNLVWSEPWTQIEVTGSLHSSALEEFRKVVMDTVLSTITAYWTLVAEEEQLRVANKSLETARALRDQTQTQYEVGVKSKVEVIEADAGVAARELDVIRADAAFNNSQDILIDAIYGVRLRPEAEIRIRPTDLPSDFDELVVDPKVATEAAMLNRPELASLEHEIKRQETLVRFRKNQRLPELGLNMSYGTSGLAGKPKDGSFAGGNFADSHNDWFEKRGGREYAVGGTFSIPLGNYAPRHNVSKARLELRRAKTRLLQLHQQIIVEIRRDVRLLDAARRGIEASERQRIAAEEQLRAERIRLEHGESTPFDVLQKESDLVEAEVAKIEALELYRTSASDLDRAQGTILRTHNIAIGSVGELRNGMEKETFSPMDILEPILP